MRTLLVAVVAALLGAVALLVYAGRYDGDPDIFTFTARDGRIIGTVDPSHNGQHIWTPLEAIPPAVIERTIRAEDRCFSWHRGINPLAIAKAAIENVAAGRIVRGGSTITQQLAKLLIQERTGRIQRRTFAAKLEEVLLAVGLEMKHGKGWILERYLNSAYYGRRAYGVAAAAEAFFGKPLAALTTDEIDALVDLPRAPGRNLFSPSFVRRGKGEVDLPPPSPPYKGGENIVGRHFIEYAAAELRAQGRTGAAAIATTLDLTVQGRVERAIEVLLASRLEDDPALTAAVVAIDVATGDLIAMAGSRDYFDAAIAGQVNAAVALRQPGSALKPFTYFAAFARGFSPDSIVPDEPLSFMTPGAEEAESYAPQNFDRRFHGELPMREALANSYNVPAVVTLNEIGLSFFHELLRRFGITTLGQPPPHYGLAVTLGAGEVTLLQLTNAYAALARGGAFLPCRFLPSTMRFAPQPVVPDAAAIAAEVTGILADPMARRRAFGFNEEMAIEGHAVAIKTGTSYEHRDAWAVGYTPSIAAGVWVGHADGSPLDPLKSSTGASAAAPLWHAVMESLVRGRPAEEFPVIAGRPSLIARIQPNRDVEVPSLVPTTHGIKITSPVSNAVYRLHAYLPIEHQLIRAEAAALAADTALIWYLDGERFAETQGRTGIVWIEPIEGRHRLEVSAGGGQKQEVVFKVIEGESGNIIPSPL